MPDVTISNQILYGAGRAEDDTCSTVREIIEHEVLELAGLTRQSTGHCERGEMIRHDEAQVPARARLGRAHTPA